MKITKNLVCSQCKREHDASWQLKLCEAEHQMERPAEPKILAHPRKTRELVWFSIGPKYDLWLFSFSRDANLLIKRYPQKPGWYIQGIVGREGLGVTRKPTKREMECFRKAVGVAEADVHMQIRQIFIKKEIPVENKKELQEKLEVANAKVEEATSIEEPVEAMGAVIDAVQDVIEVVDPVEAVAQAVEKDPIVEPEVELEVELEAELEELDEVVNTSPVPKVRHEYRPPTWGETLKIAWGSIWA
jgi:hypothetical protein